MQFYKEMRLLIAASGRPISKLIEVHIAGCVFYGSKPIGLWQEMRGGPVKLIRRKIQFYGRTVHRMGTKKHFIGVEK